MWGSPTRNTHSGGANFLFATDFHNDKIDVLDAQYKLVTLGMNGFETFTDPNLPAGFAPFNIAAVKHALAVCGHEFGPCRPPQRRLTEMEKGDIQERYENVMTLMTLRLLGEKIYGRGFT